MRFDVVKIRRVLYIGASLRRRQVLHRPVLMDLLAGSITSLALQNLTCSPLNRCRRTNKGGGAGCGMMVTLEFCMDSGTEALSMWTFRQPCMRAQDGASNGRLWFRLRLVRVLTLLLCKVRSTILEDLLPSLLADTVNARAAWNI